MTLRVHPDEIVRRSTSPLLGKHDSWERVRLRDVADVLNGFAFKSSQFSHTEGMPLLRIRDVGSSVTQIRYDGDYDSRYLVDRGAIVVGMDGDFRAARWNGPAALLNQRVCAIKIRGEELYNEDFLLYALPGYLDAINDWTSSTTVKHLSSETIKEIPLPLPPLGEQLRIVKAIEEELSRLDIATQSLSRSGKKIKPLRVSTLLQVFWTGWPATPLAALTETTRPICYGVLKPGPHDPTGVPLIRIQDLVDGRVDESHLHYISTSLDREFARSRLEGGEILISIQGTIGRVALVQPELAGANISRTIAVVAPDDTVDRTFLRFYLEHLAGCGVFEVGGSTRASLNIGTLRKVEVPVPPLSEQQHLVAKIARELSLIQSLEASISAASRRSMILRGAILARAFRGELAPQEPDDEPASRLLDRIVREPTPKRREKSAA